MNDQEASVKEVLSRSFWILLPACIALPFAAALPKVPLDGKLGILAYGIAQSGGPYGIPVLAIVMVSVLVNRNGVPRSRQRKEIVWIATALLVFLGGSSVINEHLTKPFFESPRPNIVELSESAVLKMSPEEFYALPDKQTRSEHLTKVLTGRSAEGIRLHELVREHWIAETGYSFPSGHSIAAMTLTTLLLALALSFLARPRILMVYLLVPWSILVCYSRPILRVHSATDITVGAVVGIVLGGIAFILIRFLLDRSPQEPV